MYESPISVYFSKVETQFESAVLRAVQKVGIDVDKNELVKALAYDRDQYERGYHDGLMFHSPIVTNYDRIVSKSPEELAKFMGDLPCCPPGADVKELCYPMDSCEGTDLRVQCWLDWLKQEAT